jgi:hypothetical protein
MSSLLALPPIFADVFGQTDGLMWGNAQTNPPT